MTKENIVFVKNLSRREKLNYDTRYELIMEAKNRDGKTMKYEAIMFDLFNKIFIIFRTSLEYEQGATDFVYGSSWRLEVWIRSTNGIDAGLSMGRKGDLNVGEEQTSEFEAYELFRAAFFDGDDNSIPRSNITEMMS
ncbi:unnamed protein product [Microthlaspi erraticum]|uniref:Uncharacterized protein n=1 Tax=Microthlaspi erraticum TaxID=1685480 RepID=A0A6D2IIE6_9BRAS|nr:unnamed protein product [Microthlaspi erraticum]